MSAHPPPVPPEPAAPDSLDVAAAGAAAEAASGRAASLVAGGILVSRLLGFVRNFVFARYFGDDAAADAYNAALKIPNLVRNLLGEGTISASFIPVYSAMLGRNDRDAQALAGAVLGLLFVMVSVLTLSGIALAPVLTNVLATGMDPARQELTTRLVRVLFPMTGVMVISGWCLGVQNSHRRFFLAYASAALWSVAQIVLLAGWGGRADTLAELAWWLAWATLAGAVLQVLAQLPQVLRLVRPLRLSVDRRIPGVRETLANFVPVITALGLVQISGLVDLQIASWLPEGAIASIEYARYIWLLPIGLFGISIAASSLPEFSRESAGLAYEALRDRLRRGLVRILFYIVPATVVFIAFGHHVISLLYRSGEFGLPQTRNVHLVLAAYAVGLIGYAVVKLLASAFYAMQDYRTPLRAALLSLVVGSTAALALALPLRDSMLGAAGLALGSVMGAYVNLSALLLGLRRRLGPIVTGAMWRALGGVLLASAVAAVAASGAEWALREAHFRVVAIGTLGTFGGIFLLAAHLSGSAEARRWLRALRLVR